MHNYVKYACIDIKINTTHKNMRNYLIVHNYAKNVQIGHYWLIIGHYWSQTGHYW